MRHILHIAEYIKSLYCNRVLYQVYINIKKGDISVYIQTLLNKMVDHIFP